MVRRAPLRAAALAALTLVLAGCFGDGNYTVGTGKGQVKPATWLAPGGANCQWTTTGPGGGSGGGDARQQVTVTPGDTRFSTKGCGIWEEASDPQAFSGSGSQVSPIVSLRPGPVIAASSHAGDGTFMAFLVDERGGDVAVLANESGRAATEAIIDGVAGGNYRVEVRTDGPWTVTLTQPRSIGGRVLPTTFRGTGDAVAGPFFQSDRTVVFDLHHVGERNFVVELVPSDGRAGTVVADEVGNADVTRVERLDGSYWLSVTADGPWTVSAHH